MPLSAARERFIKNPELTKLRTATTGASFTGHRGGIVMVNSSGAIVVGADTAGARALGVLPASTESSPGVLGAVASGTVISYECGQTEWFPILGGTFGGTVVGLDACIFDDGGITTGTAATNDVRLGRIEALETINGTAGAWVAVGVFSHGVT